MSFSLQAEASRGLFSHQGKEASAVATRENETCSPIKVFAFSLVLE